MKSSLLRTISTTLALLAASCDPHREVLEDEDSFADDDIDAAEIDQLDEWRAPSAPADVNDVDFEKPDKWNTNPTATVVKCWCITQCSSNPPHWTKWKNVGYAKGSSYNAAEHNCKQQAKGFCKALAWDYKHVKTYCGFH